MTGKGAFITLRRRLLGLALVVVLLAGIALSIALYNKSFSSFVTVTLKADKVGNQLFRQSDVKVRGLIVGSVENISATGDGANLTLRLDPQSTQLIPANVSARFLPKTLFGERFVSLQIPNEPSARTLRQGDVIPQDRTTDAIELDKALDDLLPVLQAVQPQKLSSTLTAISTALRDRGKSLGDTLSNLGQYFGDLNPHLPQLQTNLRELASFSGNLSDAAPDLLQSLDNLTTTTRTIADQRQNLSNLYADLTTASEDLRSFLQANSANIIGLADTFRPTAELLAKYAPEYPCVLGQMSQLVDKLNVAYGKNTDRPGLHATLEVTLNRGPYRPGQDDPQYLDKRGPRCYDASQMPFPQDPPNGGALKDGSTNPSGATNPLSIVTGGGAAGGSVVNTSAEHDLLSQLVGPQVGLAPQDVPGWGGLLVGPLYRGAEVTVK
jgi:virulence factor Mce-like protein